MFANRPAAGLAIIFFLIGFSPVVWAQEPLAVENWPVQRSEKAPGRHLRDHRRLEPLFPESRSRHEVPQYARDLLLGPEVQGPDALILRRLAQVSAASIVRP